MYIYVYLGCGEAMRRGKHEDQRQRRACELVLRAQFVRDTTTFQSSSTLLGLGLG
jgi:hypothetical protein